MKEKNGGNGGKTRANEAAERSERVPEREGWKERDGKRGMEREGWKEEGRGKREEGAPEAPKFLFSTKVVLGGYRRPTPQETGGWRRLKRKSRCGFVHSFEKKEKE